MENILYFYIIAISDIFQSIVHSYTMCIIHKSASANLPCCQTCFFIFSGEAATNKIATFRGGKVGYSQYIQILWLKSYWWVSFFQLFLPSLFFCISGFWFDIQPIRSHENSGKYFWKSMRYLDSEKHMLSLRKDSILLVMVGSFSKHKPEWEAKLLYFSLPLNVVDMWARPVIETRTEEENNMRNGSLYTEFIIASPSS